MQYGVVIWGGGAREVVEAAVLAEKAGWDGVFVPDCISIGDGSAPAMEISDPWVTLAAIAERTSRVRFGTMITALSRRRPWKVARETVTLDQLSNGRLILPVGLGALDDAGFGRVGEATDRKTRAELLDESLDIITGLWTGEQFRYAGKHYNVQDLTFQPTPMQKPRIPVWVVGAWPSERSMARVLRYDGLVASSRQEDGNLGKPAAHEIAAMKAYIDERRTGPFDIIVEGETPGENSGEARSLIAPFEEAGATWWLETRWAATDGMASITSRIERGPRGQL